MPNSITGFNLYCYAKRRLFEEKFPDYNLMSIMSSMANEWLYNLIRKEYEEWKQSATKYNQVISKYPSHKIVKNYCMENKIPESQVYNLNPIERDLENSLKSNFRAIMSNNSCINDLEQFKKDINIICNPEYIPNFRNLELISINACFDSTSNYITEQLLLKLFNTLEDNQCLVNLKGLDLEIDNDITSDRIAQIISKLKKLEYLSLSFSGKGISDQSFEKSFQYFKKNTSIKKIDKFKLSKNAGYIFFLPALLLERNNNLDKYYYPNLEIIDIIQKKFNLPNEISSLIREYQVDIDVLRDLGITVVKSHPMKMYL